MMKRLAGLMAFVLVVLVSRVALAAAPPELLRLQYKIDGIGYNQDALNSLGACGNRCAVYEAVFFTATNNPNDGDEFNATFEFAYNGTFQEAYMYSEESTEVYDYYSTNGNYWYFFSDTDLDIDWSDNDKVVVIVLEADGYDFETRVYVDLQ